MGFNKNMIDLNTVPELYKEMQIESCCSWEKEAKFFKDVIDIVEPKNILEIGFYKGGSAFMWLYMSQANLTSVDPIYNVTDEFLKQTQGKEYEDKTPQFSAVNRIKGAFGDRFNFIQEDSKNIRPLLKDKKFDLVFIDGDHWREGITNDFNLCFDLDIKWAFVDDFVLDVMDVYQETYARKFLYPPIRIYHREAQFQGKPIPMVLLKRV
jgi:predicted O-methyltransferase YrrM